MPVSEKATVLVKALPAKTWELEYAGHKIRAKKERDGVEITVLEPYVPDPSVVDRLVDVAMHLAEGRALPEGTAIRYASPVAVPDAPPRVLTMEEYERDWKPEGWELLPIGPTATWKQEWGEWEAIRDFVQNALDENEAYRWGYDGQGLWIADRGRGVAVADFLLGPPKLKPAWARGKYGEGMKVAALVMIRLGYAVHVETVGREIWMVFIQVKTGPGEYAESLHALWRHDGTRVGTKIHLIGYTGPAFEDRFAVNLPRKSIVTEGPSRLHEPFRRFNQLIQHTFQDVSEAGPSRIYARDIYMRNISSPYCYNLWSFDLAPDRHAPREEDHLWADVGRLWCCVTKVEHLKVFLQMVRQPAQLETDESHHVSMNPWEMGREPVTGKSYAEFVQENASVWQEAWRNVMGEDAVIRTSDRLDGMVKHLGYQSVSLLYSVRDTLGQAIMTDQALIRKSQERLREAEIVPDEKLSHQHRVHINMARAITRKVFPYSPPSGVHVAVIPPASDMKRTAGLYGTATGEVFISLEMMNRGKDVIDVLVHELAHHRQYRGYGEAEDLTPVHMECMQKIAAEVVEAVASGELDEELRGVVW